MDNDQFATIIGKIDLMTNALLYFLIRDLEFKEKVLVLKVVGLKESEIIALLRSNKNKVHSVLWREKIAR